MALKDVLSKIKPQQKPLRPLWEGPNGQGWNGGVTQGLLSRYCCCQERFRVQYIEGLHPTDSFKAALEFGNMWHVCEESLATGMSEAGWKDVLQQYVSKLSEKYPFQRQEINDWYLKVLACFPIYVEHWSKHPDVTNRMPLLQEQVFDVPYMLPSKRVVRLRGKWDSVDLIKDDDGKSGLWLQENKTKSAIDGEKIARQLTFDLQTLFYLIALEAWDDDNIHQGVFAGEAAGKGFWVGAGAAIKGVRYNVVRRSIHKSIDSMLKKIGDDQKAGRIGEWFARWKVDITPTDIQRFKTEFLNPILENLIDDYVWFESCYNSKVSSFNYDVRRTRFPHHHARQWRLAYGIINPVAESGFGEVDTYIETGSTVGLRRKTELFEELKDSNTEISSAGTKDSIR